MNKVNIAITLGDPASIGSEIILKSLAIPHDRAKITIIGSRSILEKAYQELYPQWGDKLANPDHLEIIDIITPLPVNWGQGNADTGKASFLYLERAIELTLDGKFDGIVTAPIAKSLWQKAGYNYPGQTEVLAEKSAVTKFAMMFVAKSPHTAWMLRTILATTHIPLKEVSDSLNPSLMDAKLDLLVTTLAQDFNLTYPHIAIAGLNPHSGEDGKLGLEEKAWLNDWLDNARKRHPQAQLTGLIPPDTLWVKPAQAWYNNPKTTDIDAFFALYHDQGLIPVKLMAFDRAVNTTIGLPFVRTSPDHGTAFDIAGKGIADASSMNYAIATAIDLCHNRKKTR